MTQQNHHYVFDAELEMKDAGLVAASAAAQVDAADKIIDFGAAIFVRGVVLIDVTAIEIASTDEIYEIHVQLSSSATFASTIRGRAALVLGANAVVLDDADSAVGRYLLYFDNEYNGTVYRYGRLYTKVGGSIATGINYSGWACYL